MQTTRGSILLAAALLAGCVLAQPVFSQDCPLPALETDGFVRVEGGRLMLGDQRFHVRGANYHGGRFIEAFPEVFPGEELYVGSFYFLDPWFLPDEIEAELAFHREMLGTNAIRIFYQFAVQGPISPVALDRIKQFLCRARRQGIRVQFAFLVPVPTTPEQHNQYVAGYGAFLVGETLLEAADPSHVLRGLRGENATEIKICGVTREEDVDACLEQGVDWIGLVFAARSPRRVSPERGISLKERARAAKGVVAVFAEDTPEEDIERVAAVVRPDVIQMPNPPLPLQKKFPSVSSFWNTIRVGRDDLSSASRAEGDALHFDTSVGGMSGGTGKTFDWSLLSSIDRSRPMVLAGGLKPENVADAVRKVKPDIVDVASGVESAPGIKDRAKIVAFVREVRGA